MKLQVFNKNGQNTGREVELPESIFGIEPNDHAIYLAVKQYLANQRQGTHKSKERNEVSGSTRKLKRQKGTGTARAGSIKSPVLGGGRVFGPRPRDYSFKLNKKLKTLAKKSALSYKAKENNIIVLEDFNMEMPKTNQFARILQGLGVADKKTLLVLNQHNPNVALSARNIPKTRVLTANTLSPYTILNCQKLIISESAVEAFS